MDHVERAHRGLIDSLSARCEPRVAFGNVINRRERTKSDIVLYCFVCR